MQLQFLVLVEVMDLICWFNRPSILSARQVLFRICTLGVKPPLLFTPVYECKVFASIVCRPRAMRVYMSGFNGIGDGVRVTAWREGPRIPFLPQCSFSILDIGQAVYVLAHLASCHLGWYYESEGGYTHHSLSLP